MSILQIIALLIAGSAIYYIYSVIAKNAIKTKSGLSKRSVKITRSTNNSNITYHN